MFKNWGAWLGIENENGQKVKEKDESAVDVSGDQDSEVNKQTAGAQSDKTSDVKEDTQPAQLLQKAKGFSGYFYDIASSASKKLSESVVETAQTLKKSVEEGNINGIIDKTILGDFQKEQEKFVQDKKAKKSGAAVPPWVGYNEEETIQQQILALSADKRNFLRDPPAGVQFHFDCEQMYPVAMVMLEEDELLRKMRFHLVPKQVKEEVFWKNYFYRVSLIKQSAQLTALAAQQAAERRDVEKTGTGPEAVHHKAGRPQHLAAHIKGPELPHEEESALPHVQFAIQVYTCSPTPPPPLEVDGKCAPVRPSPPPDAVKRKPPAATCTTKPKSPEDEVEISTSPPVSEFVSDAFDSCNINQDDLRKEMEQLVLDKREQLTTQQVETADWERELQEELQEYDVLDDNENRDDNWDREIEEMLKEDS